LHPILPLDNASLLTPAQSQTYHLNNPYWKTFDPYVNPLLEKPMDLRRAEELDTGTEGMQAHLHEDAVADTSVGTMYADADAA
jgi:hypothetical protein